AFFQELNGAIGQSLGERAKDAIAKIGQRILGAAPVIRPVINMVTGGVGGDIATAAVSTMTAMLNTDSTIDEDYRALNKLLQEQSARFLIVIDDIDRLSPEEAILIFRLVKSVGRLPNVMYMLAFERILAERIVAERFPSEGPHYLEKIIQAAFEVPMPDEVDL